MAISKQQRNKIAIFGGVAGFATPFLLRYIVMPVLNMLAGLIPQISAKLADASGTISIAVRESLTGIEGGLAGWLLDALGLTMEVPYMTYFMAAAGGAILFVLGAYAADAFKMLEGDAKRKTMVTIFAGSLIAALILGNIEMPVEVGLDLVNVLIAFAINAAILAWLFVKLDKKKQLIPY